MKLLEEAHDIKDHWVCDSTDYEQTNMFKDALSNDNEFAKLLQNVMNDKNFASL